MPTGRSVVATCAARAALAGNPSDGYGGAVVAIPITDLCVTVAVGERESFAIRSGDRDLVRLLSATVDVYAASGHTVPPVEVSASTTIPRSVGLAGSSAFVIATLRALAAWHGERWDRLELAELALAVERDRLRIEAGLQDRLVQAHGTAVSMTFDPVGVTPLELPEEFALFVAWSTDAAEPSGTVHRSLRRRYEAGDADVVEAMRSLAIQARRAERAITIGDQALLADAMDRSFDLRASILDIDTRQRGLIEIGRIAGAAVNSAGSGGSVVGLAPDPDRLERILSAYAAAGMSTLALS